METSFCELKGKEVINIVDGKKLGRIIDLVFETCSGRVLGIVVPAYNKSWNIFKASEDIFIPFGCICKFGDDAILVKIYVAPQKPQKKCRFARTASKASSIANTQSAQPENNNASQNQLSSQQDNSQNYHYESLYDKSAPDFEANESAERARMSISYPQNDMRLQQNNCSNIFPSSEYPNNY